MEESGEVEVLTERWSSEVTKVQDVKDLWSSVQEDMDQMDQIQDSELQRVVFCGSTPPLFVH